MLKNYVIQIGNGNGKLYAYAEQLAESHNLAAFVQGRPFMEAMTLMRSRKEAEQVADMLNDAAEKGGKLMTLTELDDLAGY